VRSQHFDVSQTANALIRSLDVQFLPNGERSGNSGLNPSVKSTPHCGSPPAVIRFGWGNRGLS